MTPGSRSRTLNACQHFGSERACPHASHAGKVTHENGLSDVLTSYRVLWSKVEPILYDILLVPLSGTIWSTAYIVVFGRMNPWTMLVRNALLATWVKSESDENLMKWPIMSVLQMSSFTILEKNRWARMSHFVRNSGWRRTTIEDATSADHAYNAWRLADASLYKSRRDWQNRLVEFRNLRF